MKPSATSWLRQQSATLCVALLALVVTPVARGGGSLTIEPGVESQGARVTVEPTVRSGWGVLELVDPATGVVRKTIHAGRFSPGQRFYVNSEPTLPPGKYRIRFRENIDLVLASEVKRPDEKDPKWVNPTDLALQGSSVFVLDSGLDVQETRPEQIADRSWTPTPPAGIPVATIVARFVSLQDGVLNLTLKDGGAATAVKLDQLPADQQAMAKKLEVGRQELLAIRDAKSPYLYKMDRDGKPDLAFADKGRLSLPGYYNIRCVAVDTDGKIYLPSGGHEACVFDAKGVKTPQTVGGWDGNPAGNKCTVWVGGLAFGRDNHIYIPNGGYGNGRVYDRTKSAFAGILYSFALPDYEGWNRYITADFNGAVYLAGRSQQITRYFDDGKAITMTYHSNPDAKLANATGPSASAGLIWFACHGPGPGPFWDSGGGGEVVLFFDDGQALRVVERYGTPGVAATRLEFLNPSAAIMSTDHMELWVTEDGLPNTEGPPGNGRIRRFLLKAASTQEADLDLKK